MQVVLTLKVPNYDHKMESNSIEESLYFLFLFLKQEVELC